MAGKINPVYGTQRSIMWKYGLVCIRPSKYNTWRVDSRLIIRCWQVASSSLSPRRWLYWWRFISIQIARPAHSLSSLTKEHIYKTSFLPKFSLATSEASIPSYPLPLRPGGGQDIRNRQWNHDPLPRCTLPSDEVDEHHSRHEAANYVRSRTSTKSHK